MWGHGKREADTGLMCSALSTGDRAAQESLQPWSRVSCVRGRVGYTGSGVAAMQPHVRHV